MHYYNFYVLIFLCLFSSCKDQNNPRVYKIPKLVSSEIISDTKLEDQLRFKWDTPQNWIKTDNGQLQLARYKIPYTQTENAFLSISIFSGNAGGTKANVNRWRKQLNLSDLSLEEIQSIAIKGESSLGKFSIYKIINKENHSSAFLCMILPLKNSTIFVKLDTPITGIDILEEKFISFCSSFKINR